MATMAHTAFASGDPAQAWAVTQELLDLARTTVLDGARWRFKANFGTAACEGCKGLQAGEGVQATCFQVRQCYYDNFRTGEGVVNSLLRTLGDKG